MGKRLPPTIALTEKLGLERQKGLLPFRHTTELNKIQTGQFLMNTITGLFARVMSHHWCYL